MALDLDGAVGARHFLILLAKSLVGASPRVTWVSKLAWTDPVRGRQANAPTISRRTRAKAPFMGCSAIPR